MVRWLACSSAVALIAAMAPGAATAQTASAANEASGKPDQSNT